MVKSRLKKVPQSARLSAGGGGKLLLGQCPHRGGDKLKGASLAPRISFLQLIFLKTIRMKMHESYIHE